MKSFASAMTSLRNTLIAALKSLLKGKSFIRAILAFWVNPVPCHRDGQGEGQRPGDQEGASSNQQPPHQQQQQNGKGHTPGHAPGKDAQGDTRSKPATLISASTSASTSTTTSTTTSTSSAPPKKPITVTVTASPSQTHFPLARPKPAQQKAVPPGPPVKTTDDFLRDAERQLLAPVQGDRLRAFANDLKAQFRERLLTNAACMLPSYNHQLPNGHERGRYLSLDVGGSTLRVALIELRGKEQTTQTGTPDEAMAILSMKSFKITPALKQLEGMAFFDWMAARIIETVDQVDGRPAQGTLPMGLAWSFPIEQTSLRGGMLQSMGKGFCAADTLLGQDLGGIIQDACGARGLRVELAAIVNDSAAALLSQAYAHAATRFGLILGTGVNVAVHLPVAAVGRAKFGRRPDAWFDAASHVIVNTELGMFGHGLLPVTRWDALLNAGHPKPDFQPLEHMVSGYYLGEICRFALLEAAATAGLFGGVVPPSLHTPYALDTETLSMIEADSSPTLETGLAIFAKAHPSAAPPSLADLRVVRALAALVSQRSAAIVAAAVYALWALKADTEQALCDAPAADTHRADAAAELAIVRDRTVVSFNGSVIERYPHYLEECQRVISQLAGAAGAADGTSPSGTIDLVPAKESSLTGAAVALACLGA